MVVLQSQLEVICPSKRNQTKSTNSSRITFARSMGETARPSLYHVPSLTMRADKSTHCFQSRDEVATFFQAVADSYAREGNEGGRFRNLVVQSIGARSALATVEWQLMRLDGTVVREWRQSYNLIRPDDRWQIFVSTIHVVG
jgi:hypothetical protein